MKEERVASSQSEGIWSTRLAHPNATNAVDGSFIRSLTRTRTPAHESHPRERLCPMKGTVKKKLLLRRLLDCSLAASPCLPEAGGPPHGSMSPHSTSWVTASAHWFFPGRIPSRRSCGNCGKLSALLFFAESFPSAVETGGKITNG